MSKTNLVTSRKSAALLALLLAGAWCVPAAHAVPSRSGEAMVVGQIGEAWARVFSSAVHYGKTEVHPLFEGAIVGETTRVGTGRNGQLLLVLDHGGMISLAGKTEVTLHHIGVSANGLPRQASDITGKIDLELHGGSLNINLADAPVPVTLTVKTPDGMVSAGPGEFVITTDQNSGTRIYSRSGQQSVVRPDGSRLAVNPGRAVSLRDGGMDIPVPMQSAMVRPHQMWRNAAAKSIGEVAASSTINKLALAMQLGFSPKALVQAKAILSVSPVDPPPPDPNPNPDPEPQPEPQPEPVPEPPQPPEITNRPNPDEDAPPIPAVQVAAVAESNEEQESTNEGQESTNDGRNPVTGQRPAQDMFSWYNDVGVIKGVNFWTANVENPADMWKADNFNLDLIRDDFRLAKDAGYTDIRVQLNIEVWLNDPEGFFERFTQFIQEADRADLRLVPVLLDPVALSQALASGLITSADVENFIKAFMNNFKDDGDVLYWDLFEMEGIENVSAEVRNLLNEAANWARQVETKQPITVAAIPENGQRVISADPGSSDLITFRSTDPPEKIREIIQELQRLGRPIICTDWLDRDNNNGFEDILPIFAEYKVGWFNHGLRRDTSDGNTRTHVFDQNGNPIEQRDIELIQGFKFGEGPSSTSGENNQSTEE